MRPCAGVRPHGQHRPLVIEATRGSSETELVAAGSRSVELTRPFADDL